MSQNDAKLDTEEKLNSVLDPVINYEKLHRIGEGTYGVVFQARDKTTGEIVALKKLRFERSKEGVPVTSLRELRVLQQCRHANIVELKKVVTGSRPDSIFLVFEYCEHDLGRLVDSLPNSFSTSAVKCLLRQLLEGLSFLHDRWVVHRDLKLSNLLYTRHGTLKLCDFGLARYFQPYEAPMTPRVVTLWYRAPEVLLGSETYNEAIDMWAVGCIMGELLRGEPLFPARTELDCIHMQCRLLGAPSDAVWPGFRQLEGAQKLKLPDQPYSFLNKTFPDLSAEGLRLLESLLSYNPENRLTARQALRHPWFQEQPLPRQPHSMPTFPSTHHSQQQKLLQKQQQQQQQEVEEQNARKRPPPLTLEALQRQHQDIFGGEMGGGFQRFQKPPKNDHYRPRYRKRY